MSNVLLFAFTLYYTKTKKLNIMTNQEILNKVNEVSTDNLTEIKESKRSVKAMLIMASDKIDIYLGVNNLKFYARVNGTQYVLR